MLIVCGLADHKRNTSALPATLLHVPLGTQLPSDLVCGNVNRCLRVGLWMMSFLGLFLNGIFSAFDELLTHPPHVGVQAHLLPSM